MSGTDLAYGVARDSSRSRDRHAATASDPRASDSEPPGRASNLKITNGPTVSGGNGQQSYSPAGRPRWIAGACEECGTEPAYAATGTPVVCGA
eukprot:2997155-Rhodomonas_salina.1